MKLSNKIGIAALALTTISIIVAYVASNKKEEPSQKNIIQNTSGYDNSTITTTSGDVTFDNSSQIVIHSQDIKMNSQSFMHNATNKLGCIDGDIRFYDIKQDQKQYFWHTIFNRSSTKELKIKNVYVSFLEELDFNQEKNPKFVPTKDITNLKGIIPPLSKSKHIISKTAYIPRISPSRLTNKGDVNLAIRYKIKYQYKNLTDNVWSEKIRVKIHCAFYRVIPEAYQ